MYTVHELHLNLPLSREQRDFIRFTLVLFCNYVYFKVMSVV